MSISASFLLVAAVTAGYADWQGLTPQNHVFGREVVPADLRHKTVVVIDVDATSVETARTQMLACGWFCTWGCQVESSDAEWLVAETMRRDVITLAVLHGGKNAKDVFQKAIDTKVESERARLQGWLTPALAVYRDATFDGAPTSEGKRPFVYILGHASNEVLASMPAEEKSYPLTRTTVAKDQQSLAASLGKWKRFYGFGENPPRLAPKLPKLILEGKPLAGVQAEVAKLLSSPDAATAKEAQQLADALEQTRSELLYRIRVEARWWPFRALYDADELARYWPKDKKSVADAVKAASAVPNAPDLASIMAIVNPLRDPAYREANPAAVKKARAQAAKLKVRLEQLKKSTDSRIQNGAFTCASQLESLAL